MLGLKGQKRQGRSSRLLMPQNGSRFCAERGRRSEFKEGARDPVKL